MNFCSVMGIKYYFIEKYCLLSPSQKQLYNLGFQAFSLKNIFGKKKQHPVGALLEL
jgi:hypothetical protein